MLADEPEDVLVNLRLDISAVCWVEPHDFCASAASHRLFPACLALAEEAHFLEVAAADLQSCVV